MTYEVGQVLYVLNAESMRVVPIQVVEQVVRRTIDGEKVSYRIVVPSKPDSPLAMEKIKGKIFESLDLARKNMRQNAINIIDVIIEEAREAAAVAFKETNDTIPTSPEKTPEDQESLAAPKEKLAEVVELPDGKKVKVNLPTSVDEALSPMQN
jgi:hypothetical protein